MAYGRMSTYQTSKWVGELSEVGLWFALCASDPNLGDPLAAEIVGGTYVRPKAQFALASGTVLEQTLPVRFAGIAPNTVIVAVMVMDDAFVGNMVSSYILDDTVVLDDGGSWSFAAGDYVMGLDITTI